MRWEALVPENFSAGETRCDYSNTVWKNVCSFFFAPPTAFLSLEIHFVLEELTNNSKLSHESLLDQKTEDLDFLNSTLFTGREIHQVGDFAPPPSCAWIRLHSTAQRHCRCLTSVGLHLVSKSHVDMHEFISVMYSEHQAGNLFCTEGRWHPGGRRTTGSQRYRRRQIQGAIEPKRDRQALWPTQGPRAPPCGLLSKFWESRTSESSVGN